MSIVSTLLRFGLFGILTAGVVLCAQYYMSGLEKEHEKTEPKKPFFINNYKECIICQEDFEEDNEDPSKRRIFLPRCGHQFHYECFQQWRENAKFCPLCRVDFE